MSIYIFKFSDSFIKDRVKGNKDNEEYTEKSEKVKESSEYLNLVKELTNQNKLKKHNIS